MRTSPKIDTQSIAERENLILGQAPRIPPLEDISEEMLELVRPPQGHGKPGEVPEVFRIMLHNAELLRNHRRHGTYFLVNGTLVPRDRELAILRTAWLCQAPFEWGEHVAIARRVGVTSEEIEWAIIGSTAPGWTDFDRALVAAVEELIGNAMISDAVWAVLAGRLSNEQLLEFPMLVGQYQSVAYLQNSVRMRLREDNPGLAAR